MYSTGEVGNVFKNVPGGPGAVACPRVVESRVTTQSIERCGRGLSKRCVGYNKLGRERKVNCI